MISRVDQDHLILPLFEGLANASPWDRFMRGLMARTGADRVLLLELDCHAERGGAMAIGHEVGVALTRDASEAELEILNGLASALRYGRASALEELLDFAEGGNRKRQKELLAQAGIEHARVIRVNAAGKSIWIAVIAHNREFVAADSALLSTLAPAVVAASVQLSVIEELRRRTEAAEDALGLLGIAQATIGKRGEVLAADPRWTRPVPSLPPALLDSGDAQRARYVAVVGETPDLHFLFRPSPRRGEAIVCVRMPETSFPSDMAWVIGETLGLSPREASLAALLCHGRSLVEAGRELKLTPETTRNYSKRIYAKTGAKRQAELVRRILSGVAVLA